MAKLYHYTTVDAAVKILVTQQFRFNSFINQNDPFDSIINRYPMRTDDHELDDYIKGFSEYQMTDSLVACFGTDTENSNGDKKQTMWAHYADNHKGVCLVFDEDLFISKVTEQGQEYLIQEIDYKCSMTITYKQIKEHLDKSHKDFLKYFKNNLLFAKHNDWSVENEKRIIVFSKSFRVPVSECLHKAILGFKISDDNEQLLRTIDKQLYNNKKVDIYIPLFPSYAGSLKSFLIDNPKVPSVK